VKVIAALFVAIIGAPVDRFFQLCQSRDVLRAVERAKLGETNPNKNISPYPAVSIGVAQNKTFSLEPRKERLMFSSTNLSAKIRVMLRSAVLVLLSAALIPVTQGLGGPRPLPTGKRPQPMKMPQPMSPSLPEPAQGAGNSPNWLDALGLPNDGGRLSWPLGLRVLAPAQEVQQERLHIEGLLQRAALQATSGSVACSVLKEMDRAVVRLRGMLQARGDGLAEATQSEARRFLGQLSQVVKSMP
jgi:hypothetical protein